MYTKQLILLFCLFMIFHHFKKKITLFNLINNHTFYSINKPKYARSGQFKKQTNICIIKKEVMLIELYVFSTFNTYSIYAKMTLYSTYIF